MATAINSEKKNEVTPPAPRAGFGPWAPFIGSSFAVMTVLYCSLLYAFRDSHTIMGWGPPAEKYCENRPDARTEVFDDGVDRTVCARPDLFAFQAVSGVALTASAVLGFVTWHVTKTVHAKLPPTPEGRLFGYLPEADRLAAINFTFQFWDFWISLTIPEHATAIMLSHHLMASSVGLLSIANHNLQYYGVFFLGLTEVSSIFLVFVDLANYFPPAKGSAYDGFIGIMGPLFAVTFFVYRVILWWPVSARLFMDVRSVVRSGSVNKLRPGQAWMLYWFLAMNVPLGILQLYWFTIILREVQKLLL